MVPFGNGSEEQFGNPANSLKSKKSEVRTDWTSEVDNDYGKAIAPLGCGVS
jgi:hypothetical protein